MKTREIIKRTILFLLPLLIVKRSYSQDSLRARAIDSLINVTVSRYNTTRTDLVGDTVTFYSYDKTTSEFGMVMEYWQYSKHKTAYKYHYYNGELIRASTYKQRFLKKNDYAVYYFDKNHLIHRESHGIPADQESFFLTRGLVFLKNAPERFKGPKTFEATK